MSYTNFKHLGFSGYSKRDIKCYGCGNLGHIKKNCLAMKNGNMGSVENSANTARRYESESNEADGSGWDGADESDE